jgi:hypothetical protein
MEEKIRANPYDADSRDRIFKAYKEFEITQEMETDAGLRLRTEYWILKFLNDPGIGIRSTGSSVASPIRRNIIWPECAFRVVAIESGPEEIYEELQASGDSAAPNSYRPVEPMKTSFR